MALYRSESIKFQRWNQLFYRTFWKWKVNSDRCYADGRGFFNKAAADDSDRNLIEYLRGMVAVGEKDEVTYLRNKNFSTTIVLEFTQTESDEKECLGVVFDVDTARNDTDYFSGTKAAF